MDTVRKDVIRIMDATVKHKTISEAKAIELLKLPMIVVSDEEDVGDSEEFKKLIEGEGSDLQPLPFTDSTYWIRDHGLFHITRSYKQVENDVVLCYSITQYPDAGKDYSFIGSMCSTVVLLFFHDAATQIDLVSLTRNGKDDLATAHLKNKELVSALEQAAVYAISAINEFLTICEKTERKPVIRTPAKLVPRSSGSKSVNKLKQAYDNAPRVCYLRAMPNASDPSGMGGGYKVRPHQRIRHTKTLTHERYRNHPMFRVKDGIKIETYWVGEKTAEYQGNIYKLVE